MALVIKAKRKGGFPPRTMLERVEKTGFKLGQIERMYRKGLTDLQVSEIIGVTEDCVNGWKRDFSEFRKLVIEWRTEADVKVERSLLQRALGTSFEEKTVEEYVVGDKVLPGAKRKITKKWLPPDPTSCIFWLKNRKPTEWRDRTHNVNLNGNVDDPAFRDQFFGVDFNKIKE